MEVAQRDIVRPVLTVPHNRELHMPLKRPAVAQVATDHRATIVWPIAKILILPYTKLGVAPSDLDQQAVTVYRINKG